MDWRCVSDEPERVPADHDAEAFKWHLRRDDETSFVVVTIPESSMFTDRRHLPEGVVDAIDTRGRSKVDQYLGRDTLPRRIEVSRLRDHVVFERGAG